MSLCISLYIIGSILVELCRGLYPRHQLLILHTYELLTRVATYDAIGHELLALVILRHLATICDIPFWSQIGIQSALSQDDGDLLAVICVVSLNCHIIDLRTHTEGCV